MKKILLLSVNKKRIPHLQALKSDQYEIIVADDVLDPQCEPYIDHFIPINISDKETLLHGLSDLFPHELPVGVTTFLDKGVQSCVWASQFFGLPGNPEKAARAARNKYFMRECLQDANLPHPKFAMINQMDDLRMAANNIGYPLIFKPIGGTLSKGIFRLNTAEDLLPCFEKMKKLSDPFFDPAFKFYAKGYIAEEFLLGKEFSVEGISSNGEHQFFGVTEKWINPENFIEIQHCFPARITEEHKFEILKMAEQALNAIHWKFGGFHIEIMQTANGARIIEINGRLGGDYIGSHLLRIATGIDPISIHCKAISGKPISLIPKWQKGACISFVVANDNGLYKNLKGREDAMVSHGVHTIFMEVPTDTKVGTTNGEYRIAAIITEGHNAEEAIRNANLAKNRLTLEIEC